MTPTHDSMSETLKPNAPSEMTRRSLVRALGGSLAIGGALVLPGIGQAKGKGKSNVTPRSFRELLAAQGSTSDFDPPFPDYNGWSTPDSAPPHFAYVDYAGVLAKYLADLPNADLPNEEPIHLGTKVHGTVLERHLPDGRAEITVRMITTNALTWIVKTNFDDEEYSLVTYPLDFGYRPAELIADRSLRPALAVSHLEWVFRMEEPGLPLPDIGLVSYGDPPPGQLLSYDFRARAFGAVREEFDGDVPDETRGIAKIINVGEGLDNPECYEDPDLVLVCWPEEVIEIKPLGFPRSGLETDSKKQSDSPKSAKGGKDRRRSRRRQ
jgi:hypothetical protein